MTELTVNASQLCQEWLAEMARLATMTQEERDAREYHQKRQRCIEITAAKGERFGFADMDYPPKLWTESRGGWDG